VAHSFDNPSIQIHSVYILPGISPHHTVRISTGFYENNGLGLAPSREGPSWRCGT